MTEDQVEALSEWIERPNMFFYDLKLYDYPLYREYLAQALEELQQELGKG